MKFSTSVAVASLAAGALAAPRTHHARFHDSKREIEMAKRAHEADPSLAKRCGEMVNAGQWGTFKNCWGPCASDASCSSGASPAAQPAANDSPAPAAAAPAETSAAPVNVQVANNNDDSDNHAQAHSTPAAAASSPASTPASSNSGSSSSSDSSGKVGLAYNDPSLITGTWLSGDAAWAYNWGFAPGNLNSKLDYVPMFHDANALSAFTGANLGSYSHILSLNEPDMPVSAGGSSLTAAQACTAHTSAFKGLSGKQVSSPAVSSDGETGKGLDWLSQFKSACPSAQVDFVPLHWYGGGGSGASQGADFLKYVETAKATVGKLYPGKPIWFTEFAAVPVTDAQVNADFLAAVLPTLKSDSAIARIAPFMVGSGGALGTNTPNAAGKVLIAV